MGEGGGGVEWVGGKGGGQQLNQNTLGGTVQNFVVTSTLKCAG